MNDLFNRTFFNFTTGFLAILLVAFSLAVVASQIESGPQNRPLDLEASQQIQ